MSDINKATDRLLESEIYSLLENKTDYKLTVAEKVSSTNTCIKKAAFNGEGEGSIIIADSQTDGRGRFTRRFHSPENCGIYMSILLKPTLCAEESVLITAAAAVAVSEAVEALSGKRAEIKWVNDVFVNSKKICGILTEGSINAETGGFNWAVLGIGINAYEPEGGFEEEIRDIAGFVFEERQTNLRNRLAAEVINRFFKYYRSLSGKSFLNSYRSHSLVTGKKITVHKSGVSLPATALEIDDNCRLLVEYGDKTSEYLSSGEISIRLL